LQKRNILMDRIGRPLIPQTVLLGDRRREYIKAALLPSEVPPFGRTQMLVKGPGIVLSQHRHFLNVGIRHIAQSEINGSVAARHRHRRDGPLILQSPPPPVVPACKNNSQRSPALSPSFAFITLPLSSTPP